VIVYLDNIASEFSFFNQLILLIKNKKSKYLLWRLLVDLNEAINEWVKSQTRKGKYSREAKILMRKILM